LDFTFSVVDPTVFPLDCTFWLDSKLHAQILRSSSVTLTAETAKDKLFVGSQTAATTAAAVEPLHTMYRRSAGQTSSVYSQHCDELRP